MKFGNAKGLVPRPKGKGGLQELLPSRHAMSSLVAGDPMERSVNNYAKLTPSGATAAGDPGMVSPADIGAELRG